MSISLWVQPADMPLFQLENWAETLKAGGASLDELILQSVYIIESTNSDEDDLESKLKSFLGPVMRVSDIQCSGLITPRQGTHSPWGTKTLDIFHNSGLNNVLRIEKGYAVLLLKAGQRQAITSPERLPHSLFDPMTQSLFFDTADVLTLFRSNERRALRQIPVRENGLTALEAENKEQGLSLSSDEMHYLVDAYRGIDRDPTDCELMMFAQANSEHCRHKIFNAQFTVDGELKPKSLFGMIKNTYQHHPDNVVSAYKDNAAVMVNESAARWLTHVNSGEYYAVEEPIYTLMKVETHNHPTGICPYPGASTGAGGEIRDEGATGRGGQPKAGLCGFSVSHLHLPDNPMTWESAESLNPSLASPLQIMLEAPIGAAAFNNEFGRPNLTGYFRSFQQGEAETQWGFHKPIMIAGGLGNIRAQHVEKCALEAGDKLLVLGGPAMCIGLGGGAASSTSHDDDNQARDFASVQRDNPEVQRRVQEVIQQCFAMGEENPIVSIHDVGAGGLCNALPELVHDAGRGAVIDLDAVPNHDPDMSPMEIWCNEAQERYVLGVRPDGLSILQKLCARERCLMGVVGTVTEEEHLRVHDTQSPVDPVNIPMSLLFGNAPTLSREDMRRVPGEHKVSTKDVNFPDTFQQILQDPTVSDKRFLVTIGDRTVGGFTARDQMVGPWQVPVADCAVTSLSYEGYCGEAMSMGERPPVAMTNPAASARLAVSEAILNIMSADVPSLDAIKMSANWMAACGQTHQDSALYDAVHAIGEELCPELDICIPVGKDSLSMVSRWQDKSVQSPVSAVISAFAPVTDIRQTLTPLCDPKAGALIWVRFTEQSRLGGSVYAHLRQEVGSDTPDVDGKSLKAAFKLMREAREKGWVQAYHDVSDGGVMVTLSEMAFCSRLGLSIDLPDTPDPVALAFAEEPGFVIQATAGKEADMLALANATGLVAEAIANPLVDSDSFVVRQGQVTLFDGTRTACHQLWSKTSSTIQGLRDNPDTAAQEFEGVTRVENPADNLRLTQPVLDAPAIVGTARPVAAILREQGVNGHREMAAAFGRAGFQAIDIHMQDLMNGDRRLDSAHLLAACGGFSYGDVLGAGNGWAASILNNDALRSQFQQFFERETSLTFGVCNGCQMLSRLKDLIPGAGHWPGFEHNLSQRFEARMVWMQVDDSPSVMFSPLKGSCLPVVVSHGEGRVVSIESDKHQTIIGRYVDHEGQITERYPDNPNGSVNGVVGMTSEDGRASILMPHPERCFRSTQLSWYPKSWEENSPWFNLFVNAFNWIQDKTR